MKFVCFSFLFFCSLTLQAQKTSLGADEFEQAIRKDSIQLLDVRTASEYNGGHISGSLLADWTDKAQFTDRTKYIDKNQPLYVYCLAGGRSSAAANWLRQQGFLHVYDLAGGMNAWKSAGKPVEGLKSEPPISLPDYLQSIPSHGFTLVDVGAEWCPPCVKMQPVIRSLTQDSSLHFTLKNIDAGTQTALLNELNISPIPVFIIYKDGKETWRHQGLCTREELAEHLN